MSLETWVNLYVGASSGSIQVGVASLRRSGANIYAKRVMHSGVIACPTANTPARIDCGATVLEPGDYVLFIQCDNTTATFMNGLVSGITASRLTFNNPLSGGLGSARLSRVS